MKMDSLFYEFKCEYIEHKTQKNIAKIQMYI